MKKTIDSVLLSQKTSPGKILAALGKEGQVTVSGLQGAAKSFLISRIFSLQDQPLVAILPGEKEALAFYRDCRVFLDHSQVMRYPAWNIMTTDFLAPQKETTMERLSVLFHLLQGGKMLIVASLPAVIQNVMPRDVFSEYNLTLSIGDTIDWENLTEKLVLMGYTRQTLVEERGDFSVRGHIVDIFPSHSPAPFRVERMGDEIESIRRFDAISQRSIEEVIAFRIPVANELILTEDRRRKAMRNIRIRANDLELPRQIKDPLMETIDNGLLSSLNPMFLPLFYCDMTKETDVSAMGTFFDYCLGTELFFLDDPSSIQTSFEDMRNTVDHYSLTSLTPRFFLPGETFLLPQRHFAEKISSFPLIQYGELLLSHLPEDPEETSIFSLQTEKTELRKKDVAATEESLLSPLVEEIHKDLEKGHLVFFLCPGKEDIQRMTHLLAEYDIVPDSHNREKPFMTQITEHISDHRFFLLEGKISAGFRFPEFKLTLFTQEEIFGRKQVKRLPRPAREGYFLRSFSELAEGNFIVHKDHGIGVYRGLHKMTVSGTDADFLLIAYEGNDKLYIPIDRLDQIQRYIGPDEYTPKVDRLGGTTWETVKERAKKSIREVAEELVSIYAIREITERESFSTPDRLYDEFCASFEYEETPDQARAIEDIHEDMNRGKPMDRLICGDAGFGKTEVALRASFRAAMDGRQVAVLVPTTLLAEQHYQTFSQRLKDYPLRVEVLNRLKTKKEQASIVKDINSGRVDIVIGTHRILQKDILFKNLGLVIIDEEHRFGVSHKERLKKIRALVDVLTLSATPIPRTLHLSLVGIRDLSIINTPPEDRQPIQTYVVEFDEEVIRKAILHELHRQGQVFFLHDRIQSIFSMANFLEKLVPEAQTGVIHGRMKPSEIEDAMIKFIRGDFQILLCTTIVASGIDIPSANTIIINRADRMGLSLLYQIRGRVGRAKEEAFAWLVVPKGAMLSKDAQKRIQTLLDFSEPGSGFRIASNDLEIRGTGNLLGTSQSGHISAVGYEMYTELMEKMIWELKGEPPPPEEIRAEIHLGIPAFIPEDYMPDERMRLLMYKRISMAKNQTDIEEIRREFMDCYAFCPPELENLLRTIALRHLLEALRSRKMTCDANFLCIHLSPDSPLDPGKIIMLSQKKLKGTKLTPEGKLYIPMMDFQNSDPLSAAENVLKILCAQFNAP